MSYKIYKLSNDEGAFYIGSTKKDLNKRLSQHQSSYKRFTENKIPYYSAMDVLKGTNTKIELLEDLGEITAQEAKLKENEYICNIVNCVNKNKAFTTNEEKKIQMKQYYKEHKDKIKEWYLKNKDRCLQNRKKYYEENKEKFKEWYEENKEKHNEYNKKYYSENKDKHKQYYQTKKEELKQKHKSYYEANKDKIIERQKKYYENKKAKTDNN